MIRKIVSSKDPILRKIAKPVSNFDKKILKIAKDMEETLKIQKDPEGVGLAAPQVGKSLRIFSMVDNGKIRTLANPEIIKVDKEIQKNQKALEGCLSIPYYYGPITRAKKILIKYSDLEGKTHEELFRGFSAQIVQHEIDHLEGKLFIDIVLTKNLPLYFIKGNQWEEVEITK